METWRALGDQMTSSFSKEWGFKEFFFFLLIYLRSFSGTILTLQIICFQLMKKPFSIVFITVFY